MDEQLLPHAWTGKPGIVSLNDEPGTVQVFAQLIDVNRAGVLVSDNDGRQRFYTWAGVAWIEVKT